MTKRFGVAAVVLTGAFAGLAAAGNSGKPHRAAAKPRLPRTPAAPTRASTRVPAPPSLPPFHSSDDGQSQSSPPSQGTSQQPPVQTQAPPVAVSGGS